MIIFLQKHNNSQNKKHTYTCAFLSVLNGKCITRFYYVYPFLSSTVQY